MTAFVFMLRRPLPSPPPARSETGSGRVPRQPWLAADANLVSSMGRVLASTELEPHNQELHARMFGAVDQVRLVLREVAVRSEAGSGGTRVVAAGYRCLENLAEELVRSAEGGSGVVVREPTSGRVVGGSGLPAIAVLAHRLALDLAAAMKEDLGEAPHGTQGQRLRALFASLEEELLDMTEILGASHKW